MYHMFKYLSPVHLLVNCCLFYYIGSKLYYWLVVVWVWGPQYYCCWAEVI